MAVPYFRSVDVASVGFEPLEKDNNLYVARLSPPLQVQTPPVQLGSALDPDNATFVYIRPTGQFKGFLESVEAWILAKSIEHKAEWFRREVDDEVLRHNFKSFFRDANFKVRVEPEVPVYDKGVLVGHEEATEGRHVRCVLELVRVCFGQREFGGMWKLVQAGLVEEQPCLISQAEGVESDGEDPEHPGPPEEQEFA